MKRGSMKKQEAKGRRWWGRLGAVMVMAVLFGLMEMAGSGVMAVTSQEIGPAMPGLAAWGVVKADSGSPEGQGAAEWAQIQYLIKAEVSPFLGLFQRSSTQFSLIQSSGQG